MDNSDKTVRWRLLHRPHLVKPHARARTRSLPRSLDARESTTNDDHFIHIA